MDSLLANSKEVARKFYQSAQIVAQQQLTADDALTKQLTEEFLNTYIQSGFTEAQAKELLEGEGKTEFEAKMAQKLAERFFIQNNTFPVATE